MKRIARKTPISSTSKKDDPPFSTPIVITISAAAGTNVTSPGVNFDSKSGGDGWDLALTPERVYNMYHHAKDVNVKIDCHIKATGAPCPGYEAGSIVVGVANMRNTNEPFLYFNDALTKLYTYGAIKIANRWTSAVFCYDVSVNPPVARGNWTVAPLGSGDDNANGGPGAGARIGSKIYALQALRNTAPNVKNNQELLCFDIAADASCPEFPKKIDWSPYNLNTDNDPRSPWTRISGGKLYFFNPTVRNEAVTPPSFGLLTCLDPSTFAKCAGNWPIVVPKAQFQLQNNAYNSSIPQQFPFIGPDGVESGICIGGVQSSPPSVNAPYFWTVQGNPIALLNGYQTKQMGGYILQMVHQINVPSIQP